MPPAVAHVSMGSWQLEGKILSPTRSRLQAHTALLSSQSTEDCLITFHFRPYADSRTVTIHRSLLDTATGPLSALLPSITDNTVHHHPPESYETFSIIRTFLYCLPIDMSRTSPNLSLSAHRWQLRPLFDACFVWAELSRVWDARQLMDHWMPILSLVHPPDRFRNFFALRFAAGFATIAPWLSTQLNWQWGTRSIWRIFHIRRMLLQIVRYVSRFSPEDFSPIFLDVVLRQLPPALPDAVALDILRQLDWASAATAAALTSPAADAWSRRAWRLIALTPTPGYHPGGQDFRMQWSHPTFSEACHHFPICQSSEEHSEFFHQGLKFSMSLLAWSSSDPLSLRICIHHTPDVIVRRLGPVSISARVSVIESACNCDLQPSYRQRFLYHSRVSWPHIDYCDILPANFAKDDGGVEIRVMNTPQFQKWRARHKFCGLLICVRLRMEPQSINQDYNQLHCPGSTPNQGLKRSRSQPRIIDCSCTHCINFTSQTYHPSSVDRDAYCAGSTVCSE